MSLLIPGSKAASFSGKAADFMVTSEPSFDMVNSGYVIRGVYPDYGAIVAFLPLTVLPANHADIMTEVEAGQTLADIATGLGIPSTFTIAGKFGRGNIGSSNSFTTVAYVQSITA